MEPSRCRKRSRPTRHSREIAGGPDAPWGSDALCRDLHDMSFDRSQASTYWNYWGHADEMDADLNGVPCETVY